MKGHKGTVSLSSAGPFISQQTWIVQSPDTRSAHPLTTCLRSCNCCQRAFFWKITDYFGKWGIQFLKRCFRIVIMGYWGRIDGGTKWPILLIKKKYNKIKSAKREGLWIVCKETVYACALAVLQHTYLYWLLTVFLGKEFGKCAYFLLTARWDRKTASWRFASLQENKWVYILKIWV